MTQILPPGRGVGRGAGRGVEGVKVSFTKREDKLELYKNERMYQKTENGFYTPQTCL